MQEIDYYYRAYDRVLKEMFIGIAEHRDDGFLVRFEHFEDENPIYMRATGVVDDYYMMVYEGDIVRIREKGEEWRIYQIKYFGKKNYPAFDLEPYIACDCNGLSYAKACCEMEIIGNIYENPELLEV